LQLSGWVQNRHEEVEVLLSSDLTGLLQCGLAVHFAYVEGRRRPVVAVSDVSAFKLLEFFCEELSLLGVNLPQLPNYYI